MQPTSLCVWMCIAVRCTTNEIPKPQLPHAVHPTGMRYLLLDPATNVFGTVCEFSEDDLTPVMLQPLPSTQQAVLLMVGGPWV